VLELSGRLLDPRGLSHLRPKLRRFRPDVIHAHDLADPRSFVIFPPALRVLTVHDPTPHPGQDAHGSAVSRLVLRRPYAAWRRWADMIVLHSESLAARFHPRPEQRVAIIAHGIDVARAPLPLPDSPAIGFLGRLEPYKGLEVLAGAMKRIWEVRPDVRLLFAGSGASSLPLDDPRVERTLGYLPERAVDGFLARSSLIALPYTEASQSGVGSVAVGRGVPVVASRLGALPDLVLDESYLAAPGDDADLARTLLRNLDHDLAVRERVLSEIAAPRSWDAVGRLTLTAYASARAERRTSAT
jgi:glycosyltransferase involved in cell wall biosynthesis